MKNKILFVVSLLFGLMFINGGLNKFLNYIPVPKDMPEANVKLFTALMSISWLIPLIAVVEIIGGVLIIIPRTRALGALMIFPILVGIVLAHFTIQDGIPMAAILSAVLGWIMYESKDKYISLIK